MNNAFNALRDAKAIAAKRFAAVALLDNDGAPLMKLFDGGKVILAPSGEKVGNIEALAMLAGASKIVIN